MDDDGISTAEWKQSAMDLAATVGRLRKSIEHIKLSVRHHSDCPAILAEDYGGPGDCECEAGPVLAAIDAALKY